jgi:hypothetical protein
MESIHFDGIRESPAASRSAGESVPASVSPRDRTATTTTTRTWCEH